MRLLLSLITVMFFVTSAHAEGKYRVSNLTTQEIERVRAVKELLGGVDPKPLTDTINELERMRHPLINIQMKEAMAKTYIDLVRDFNIDHQEKKAWLYSMVCLNMAYLQFGGALGKSGSTTELNRLIRQKLKAYLPSGTLNQPGFIHSLE